MGHVHDHGHHHHAPAGEGGDGRLVISIALNLAITVAEIVGGIVSGSLALLSDALHNLSDTASLGVSLAARRISRREPTADKTFGYKRAEVIGAFVNLVTLVLVALYLVGEAVERLLDPQPIDGTVMLAVASIGLAANLATALLLFRQSRDNLNIRSAFLHIVSDAVSSVGVVAGGVLIVFYEVYLVDPILTMAISAYLLYHSYHMLRQTIDILMEGTPRGVDLGALIEVVEGVDRVCSMHHVHVWQLDERHVALEAHIVIEKADLNHMEHVKREVKHLLASRFDVTHSTLEFEFLPCPDVHDPDCYARPAVETAPSGGA